MSEAATFLWTGHAEAEQSQTYTHLPFEVPTSTTRIDVRYEYGDRVGSDPHLTDGNTVDIGIFDTRGAGFMTDGFRGWSGSARSSFFIEHEEATPGYLAGVIQAGTWQICLGLYKIALQGCDYRVEIKLTIDESANEGTLPTLLPMRSTPGRIKPDGWYCGELHCHTYHSDGDSDPLEIVRLAESLGLDFLAITDHNVLSHLARLNSIDTPLILIPGFEVTTYKGHWNVWGDHGWIDFRIEDQMQMAQAVDEALRCGYVVSCNHPRPFGPDWVYTDVDNFGCIEVWNGSWALHNDVSLEFWESRLRRGERYTAVGGSDNHFLKREHSAKLAHPTLWVYCEGEPTAPKLLDAVQAGRVTISESPTGARIMLDMDGATIGDTIAPFADGQLRLLLRLIGGAGTTLELRTGEGCVDRLPIQSDEVDLERVVTLPLTTPYIRAQLVDDQTNTVRALTNPIYIR